MTHAAVTVPTPTVVQAGEGTPVDAFGSEIVFMLTAENTGGAFTLGLATVPPGEGPPPHAHGGEDEIFILVEGRYGIFDGAGWTEAGPGAVVFLPRGSTHTFRNAGETVARHWVLTTPSGFESFYRKSAEAMAAGGPPDMGRILAIAAEHGIRFV